MIMVVARVTLCPGRKRTVPTVDAPGFVTIDFPDAWFTEILGNGTRTGWMVSSRRPEPVEGQTPMNADPTCLGQVASTAVRRGLLLPAEAYWNTSTYADHWRNHQHWLSEGDNYRPHSHMTFSNAMARNGWAPYRLEFVEITKREGPDS